MKKILSVVLVLLPLTLCFSGCGKTEENTKVENAAKEMKNALASEGDIVKSGEISNADFSTQYSDISFFAWDLGYTANPLNPGVEALCLKFHLKNKTDSEYSIESLFAFKAYCDGVEHRLYQTNFYGAGYSYVSMLSNIRSGAEVDVDLLMDCPVEGNHSIDIDVYEIDPASSKGISAEGKLVGSFSFTVE